MSRTIAIIPARGGSKRIPKKNIKDFLGKPIILYAIEAAISSNIFDVVMVSTDDMEIAKLALKAGAEVPFMRSPNNSNDFSTTGEVLEEVINKYASLNLHFDFACCIYPTAPFVTADLLKKGFDLLNKYNYDSVFPVTPYSYPIQRSLFMDKNQKISMVWNEYMNSRSQDLEKRYHDTGLFYWFKPYLFINEKVLFTENSGCIELSEIECQDIDNTEDWLIAEIKYNFLKSESTQRSLSKLILGTAQIGMLYGVNNTSGLLSLEDSLEILNYAKLNGIKELDTANAYGESERVIGIYNRCTTPFIINTKVLKANFNNLYNHVVALLDKMDVKFIDTLYIHKLNDFIENKDVLKNLMELKKTGICRKIGLTVYSNEEILLSGDIEEVDVIQCPFNLLDNENIRGESLKYLKQKGKEVHVRSIFLQGLFFVNTRNISTNIINLKPYLIQINEISKKYNCSISNLAFHYVLSKPYIDKVIFGVDNIEQLKFNFKDLNQPIDIKIFDLIDSIKVKETNLLNPGNWHL